MDKTLLDSLWNHYWVNTLSSSSLLTNAEYTTGQIYDLADKLETWDHQMGRGAYAIGHEVVQKLPAQWDSPLPGQPRSTSI